MLHEGVTEHKVLYDPLWLFGASSAISAMSNHIVKGFANFPSTKAFGNICLI